MGGFEPVAKPWGMDGIPENFEFGMLPDDWDQFQILMENALTRLPALETAEIKTFMNGPRELHARQQLHHGRAPELKNFYVAAGFNSIGIASGGGAGRALAEWIVNGEPTLDLWPVDIRRFAAFHDDDTFLKARVSEVLGLHYMMPWPNRELQSARPQRTSPLYERLKGKHALFGAKMAGSGRISSHRMPKRRGSTMRGAGRTGFRTRRPSTRRRVRRLPLRTSPRSRSFSWKGVTPRPHCNGSAPTMSRSRSGRRSTPGCSMRAAPTRAI